MRHHLLCPVGGRGPLTQWNIPPPTSWSPHPPPTTPLAGLSLQGERGDGHAVPPPPPWEWNPPSLYGGTQPFPPLGISLLTLKRGNSKVPAWSPHCPKWHPPPPPILVWQIQQVGGSCDRNYCLFFNIFQDLAKMWKPTNNNELDSKRYLTSLKLQVFSSLYLQ